MIVTTVSETLPNPAVGGAMPEAVAPVQAFAEHVELVRQYGDPLDLQMRLHYGPSLKAGGLTGMAVGVMAGEVIYNGDLLHSSNPIVNGALLAAGGLVAASRIRRSRNMTAGAERYSEETQDTVGQTYELFTARKKDSDKDTEGHTVDMRWYGPTDNGSQTNGDGLDNLAFMAVTAKSAGVRKMAIGDGLLQQITDNPGQPTESMAAMLRRAGFRIGGRAKEDMIHVKTPEEWLALVQQERTAHGFSLDSMLARLQRHSFDHPLARVWRNYPAGAVGLRNDALLRVSRAGTERQFDDVWGARNEFGVVQRHNIRGSLTPKGDYVHQFNDGTYNTTTELSNALGMTDAALQAAVENGDSDPNAAIRALEVLVFKKLKQLAAQAQTEDNAPKQLRDKTVPYQAEILKLKAAAALNDEKLRLRSLRLRRAACFMLTMPAFAIGLSAGTFFVQDKYWQQADKIHQQLVDERHIDSDALSYDDPDVEGRLGPWRPWSFVGPVLENTTDFLDHGPVRFRPHHPFSGFELKFDVGSDFEPSAPMQSKVGNIDPNDRNHPQWHLQPVNMSSAGYWVTSIANRLDLAESGDDSGIISYWMHDNNRDQNLQYSDLPTSVPEGITQYVGVNRLLSFNDFLNQDSGPAEIYIPVLEGTKPVAATLGGKPLKLAEREDGTYYLILPAGDKIGYTISGNLNYWVAPTKMISLPHAHGRRFEDVSSIAADYDAINMAWEKIIPGLPKENGDPAVDAQRTKMIGEYIQANWDYKLQPWAPGLMSHVQGLDTEVARANQAGAANCNVTADLLAKENDRLAPAMGFMNSNNNTLSAHDAHMWLVDDAGTRMDYTPTKGISAADAAYFNENYGGVDGPSGNGGNLWLYADLALLAAGAALWRRRDIVRASRFVAGEAADFGEHRLGRVPADQLKLAVALAERAAYGTDLSVSRAADRVKYIQGDPADVLARLLSQRSGLHTTATQRKLLDAARQTPDRGEQRQLRQSARTLGRARRVTRFKRS